MIREVVRYPDVRLKSVCEPLSSAIVSAGGCADLAKDLVETMRSFPGCVGIAAPQIGELVRMVAIDVSGHKKARSCAGLKVLINPVVVKWSGSVAMREGCLSIPDFTANVVRAEMVVIEAVDVEGGRLRIECDAYEARVVLHEIDHLDGLLFLDRVSSAKEMFPRKRYQ